jgi:hypothetical protein
MVASDTFGILLVHFCCLILDPEVVVMEYAGGPCTANGRAVCSVRLHLGRSEEVLHTYTSWWDTVGSMKEDIVRNVFVPRVWEHLVADHAAEWTQQTAPHIPDWRGKQLYKFIAEDPKLRALVGMSLSAAEPAEVWCWTWTPQSQQRWYWTWTTRRC